MNAAPCQRELVATHIRYGSFLFHPQYSDGQLTLFIENTWYPFADPSLDLVLRCYAATHHTPLDLVLELVCRSDASISSTKSGFHPRPHSKVEVGLAVGISGIQAMCHSASW
jgi:hypothetical protein